MVLKFSPIESSDTSIERIKCELIIKLIHIWTLIVKTNLLINLNKSIISSKQHIFTMSQHCQIMTNYRLNRFVLN
jgi:hypothetical protein